MHVAIIGAGLIGLTTAHYIARAGHRVTIIEQSAAVANGASHANAAQLSYSFTNALASPALLWKIPALAMGRDPAILVRGGAGASLTRWALQFLSQCTSTRAQHNTLSALAITLRSKILTEQLIDELALECSFRRAGKLVLLSTPQAVENARASCAVKSEYGCDARVITSDEAVQLEPSIARMKADYAGAVYSGGDQVADARQFCEALSDWLLGNTNTTILFNAAVTHIAQSRPSGIELRTNETSLSLDAVVVCAGAHSSALMAKLGVRLPVYPVRGYSVTLPAGAAAPAVSLTDDARRVVLSRLNDTVRISGFADFVGFGTARDTQRTAALLRIARKLAPQAAHYNDDNIFNWGGFRPMTPTGLPITAASKVPGLFVNTGHGMLGWTMACAGGHDMAQQIEEYFSR